MKYILLISCLFLCFCSFKNGEPGSVEPELSILDCPSEDVDEYPIPEPDTTGRDGLHIPPMLSVKELSFGKQGGVRCVVGVYIDVVNGINCRHEYPVVSSVGGDLTFKRLACPWFTATKIDHRTLHILVSQNKTGNEREGLVDIECGYQFGCEKESIAIIQSLE